MMATRTVAMMVGVEVLIESPIESLVLACAAPEADGTMATGVTVVVRGGSV